MELNKPQKRQYCKTEAILGNPYTFMAIDLEGDLP